MITYEIFKSYDLYFINYHYTQNQNSQKYNFPEDCHFSPLFLQLLLSSKETFGKSKK